MYQRRCIETIFVNSMWLGYMASHKYSNYTSSIYCIAVFCIVMLLSQFSNDKPATPVSPLYAWMASHCELLTRRTYHIQGIGPRIDLVRCSGTWNFPPLNLALKKTNPCNFILKQFLQYMELLQCNGEGELNAFVNRSQTCGRTQCVVFLRKNGRLRL